ncbi:MAG: hypothetical protein AAGJ81_15300 [Verrucomicrobiota bacterium]
MKSSLVIILLVAAAILAALRFDLFDRLPLSLEDAVDRVSNFDLGTPENRGPITLTSSDNRELVAKVTGKQGPFIQLERQADGEVFLLPLNRLSEKSRNRLASWNDFNEDNMRDELFVKACDHVKADFVHFSARGCALTRRDNEEALEFVESFGLQTNSLAIEPDERGYYTMPIGMDDSPRVRVAGEYFKKNQVQAIKDAVVAEYIALF